MRSCRFPVLSLAAICLVAGCKPRDEIQVYQAPREGQSPPAPDTASESGTHRPDSKVPWTVPEGWTEKASPPGGMRIASYAVTAPDGRAVDISVVPLGGTAGSLLANVNRWRDQIGLGPITEADLAGLRQPVAIGELSGDLYDMAGDKAVLDGKYKARTLAAFFVAGDTTVFFKATGEDALVAENRPKFLAWLKSVQTGPAPQATAASPASAPAPAAAPGAPAMKGPVAAPPSTGLPNWTVPAGWKSVPASTMRLASFAIDGANGQTGDLSVVALGPSAGGLLANVNRWRGQMALSPLDDAGLARESTQLTTPAGDEAVIVDLAGEGASAGKRMLAAVVSRPDRTWFYKLTGDGALVAAQKDAFLGFVKSVKYP
ncbi:MAG: hypothetical protein JNL10_07055 [Verrucomicrobiales bacterium]|nr:hypothetical protein [Verrucomicrobiales bacterium]